MTLGGWAVVFLASLIKITNPNIYNSLHQFENPLQFFSSGTLWVLPQRNLGVNFTSQSV